MCSILPPQVYQYHTYRCIRDCCQYSAHLQLFVTVTPTLSHICGYSRLSLHLSKLGRIAKWIGHYFPTRGAGFNHCHYFVYLVANDRARIRRNRRRDNMLQWDIVPRCLHHCIPVEQHYKTTTTASDRKSIPTQINLHMMLGPETPITYSLSCSGNLHVVK